MLNYQKTILDKVSFDKGIFKKELEKSFKWLSKKELKELCNWVEERYSNSYGDIIEEVLGKVAA